MLSLRNDFDRDIARMRESFRREQPSVDVVVSAEDESWAAECRDADASLMAIARHLDVSGALRRHKSEQSPLGCTFSLMRPLGLERRETAYTRALAWLLDSRSAHGFGLAPARALWRLLRSRGVTVHGASDAVHGSAAAAEVVCDAGRLDVVVHLDLRGLDRNPRHVEVVIEAKVDAPMSPQQASRYQRAKPNCVLVYLSQDPVEIASWHAVSYMDVAIAFARVLKGARRAPGAEWLRLFLASILSEIYGWPLPMTTKYPAHDVVRLAHFLRAWEGSKS